MKKLIITLTSIAVIAGGTVGAYQINEKRKINKAVADVTSVSLMANEYYGNDLELSGVIYSGNIQNVILDSQKLVEKILVKEGDTVKKGDSLLKYDITLLELEVKQKENAAAVAESDIKIAQKQLAKLKKIKPSEMKPEPIEAPEEIETEPDIETPSPPSVETKNTIKTTADSVSGDGSVKNPLVFNCISDTVVTKEFLKTLKANGGFATFNVYNEDSYVLYQWSIIGSELTDKQITDRVIGENVEISKNGEVTVNWSETMFGSFTLPKAQNRMAVNIYEEGYFDLDYNTDKVYNETINEAIYTAVTSDYLEDYMYTKKELAKMISDKELEIEKLKIEKKAADLEYKIAKEQKDSGFVLSKVDGVVSKVSDIKKIEVGEPCVVVEGEGGLTIKGYIGEMNMDKVSPGSFVNVMSWETGEMMEAEVTKIDPNPVSYESQVWNENPNSSTYQFTALSNDNTTAMSADMGVSITIPAQEESGGILIPKVYVRESDEGYYVYKADENARLKKQYVKIGKTVYGSQIQLLSGLTVEDKISFPYGKNIRDGIKTKNSDVVLW